MSNEDLQGTLSEIIQTATRILGEAIDLRLAEPDMTTEQKENAAAALKECASIFNAYAGDFRKIARSERAEERRTMQILELQPIDEPGGGHRAIACFDLQLTPECRLYGLRLLRMRDGRLLTFAPQSGYRRVATFATPLAAEITRLAIDELKAVTAHASNQAA